MNDAKKRLSWQDAALPVFATASVLVILFRLPTGLMDLLLSINLALSTVLFLSTFFIRKPLDFSSFPTLLLTTTLYRLVLNVSTTRLILTQGDAGGVIDAFSRFVAGDSIVVGGVIFLIFIIIQFVVITKGTTRISEVSARFALDALPGRQSAIDFDLNAGNITAEEARAARAELNESADFFGAMDGASKFVRGDAIAGLAIVAINIIGGLCIGIFQDGKSVGEAAALYSKLTIGDGLVSQIPAFLISLATGLLVARASRSQNLSRVAARQTLGRPIVLASTGAFLLILALTGLPVLPLVFLACGCFALAWAFSRGGREDEDEDAREESGAATSKKDADTRDEEAEVDQFLKVEPFEVALGLGLLGLAEPEDGPSLLDRIRKSRNTLASELGVILPKARVVDDPALDDGQFAIRVNGETVKLGVIYPQYSLAVATDYSVGAPRGLKTRAHDGRDAYWLDATAAEEAEEDGFETLSAGDALEAWITETARREADALLSRDATMRLLEKLRQSYPALVEEALARDDSEGADARARARLAHIQRVLQLLLREGVSIRRLNVILEAINDLALREPDADPYRALEFVRRRLARAIAKRYLDEDGALQVAMLDPAWEDALRATLARSESGEPSFTLEPSRFEALVSGLRACVSELSSSNVRPILLVDHALRYALRALAVGASLDLPTLAFDEVDPSVQIDQVATIAWSA